MQRRGIVEDQLDIQGEQVGEAKIQGLLDVFFMGFEHIHSSVEMMQGQRIGSGNADIFA
jgi:hypothetical protein